MSIGSSFLLVFKKQSDAKAFERYWPKLDGDDSDDGDDGDASEDALELYELGFPEPDDWDNAMYVRRGALIWTIGESDFIPEEVVPALKSRTQLMAISGADDENTFWKFLVNGKKATSEQAIAKAIELKVDADILLKWSLDLSDLAGDASAIKQVLASGADPNAPLDNIFDQRGDGSPSNTPALGFGRVEAIGLALLDAGANPKLPALDDWDLYYHWKDCPAVISRFRAAGVKPLHEDEA